MTTYHTLGGLKQQKQMQGITWKFGRSEVQNGPHEAKIKVLTELCSFLEALGEKLF